MRMLVVAATAMEIAPVIKALGAAAPQSRMTSFVHRSRDIDVLLTGVGMVAAAAWTSRALSERTYDLALNAGICGSFDAALMPGAVVNVVTDTLAELGAEDGDAFLPLESLGLADGSDGPHSASVHAKLPANAAIEALPAVSGITVNTIHGDERSIAKVVARFHPHVESMEGAGFMFACAIRGIPFAQVRSVSNMVERRSRGTWKIPAAIEALAPIVMNILEAR